MIAGIGRIVARAAKSLNGGLAKIVVKAGHAGEGDICCVEKLFAARDRFALKRRRILAAKGKPVFIEIEDVRIEFRTPGRPCENSVE